MTRSPLVLRDLDQQKRLEWVRVGLSITSVPTRRLEPGVPPLVRRIDTLRRLNGAGITTYVSLAPVIPGIVMVDFDRLFRDLRDAGVSSVHLGVLTFSGYEESRRMFEGAAGMTTGEALVGRDELVAKLSGLIRNHSMEPKDDRAGWEPEPRMATLESYGSA